MGMGYGMGESLKELADKRLARLAERYGKPVDDFVPEPVAPLHALEDATVQQPEPEKKKGGRPKGSKNKAK